MNLHEIGEFGLIERLKSQLLTREGVRLGIGDDAATLESLHCPVVTMDALVEGIHFRRDWTTPRALGRKAMAVNVSDLAASGARPVAAFVSIALGPHDTVEWVESLYAGFEDMASQFHFTVAGGDTVKSRGDTMISVALIGEVLNREHGPVLRSGAQIGDVLLVSGTLGDAAAGLVILQNPDIALPTDARETLLARHHEPTPRLDVMRVILELAPEAIHAALDLSDGIVGDAAHLAKRSGIRVQIEAENLPISASCLTAAAVFGANARDWALSGGEDFELLMAVAPEKADFLAHKVEEISGVPLSRLGQCAALAGQNWVEVRSRGELLPVAPAWTHF